MQTPIGGAIDGFARLISYAQFDFVFHGATPGREEAPAQCFESVRPDSAAIHGSFSSGLAPGPE